MYSQEDGIFAVKTARQLIEAAVSGKVFTMPEFPEIFKQKSGVFVTINTFPKNQVKAKFHSDI